MLRSGDDFLLVELGSYSDEYKSIVAQLDEKDAKVVLGIKRVQHPGHYRQHESLFREYGGDRKKM